MGERGKEEYFGGLEMQFGEGIVGGGKGKEGGRKGEEDLARWCLTRPSIYSFILFYRIIYNLLAG